MMKLNGPKQVQSSEEVIWLQSTTMRAS